MARGRDCRIAGWVIVSSAGGTDPDQPAPTVFLSYASEDRRAARLIGDALPAYGLEVWYDESELGGGDAWDQKIRKQIRECDYFMPLVSAQTEARHEGYFRREWRLAVERTLDMADDHTFLLPIVIDDTDEARARVPEKFLAVQWLRVPGGQPTPALEALCRRIVSGETTGAQIPKRPLARPGRALVPALKYPDFPKEEPGRRMRFGAAVVGWAFRSAWIFFKRFPRWLRIVCYIWLGVVLLAKGCTPRHHDSAELSPAEARKLKTISDEYQGSANKADIAKLGAQIAREFTDAAGGTPTERSPLMAIPFAVPAGDAASAKLADSTFAQVYGRVAISQHGRVGLSQNSLPSCDSGAAVERGRANQAAYVLCGAIDTQASVQVLTIKIFTVADASVLWSKSYPVAGADPTKIATEVDAKVPSLEDE
jgi:TolB-like protein